MNIRKVDSKFLESFIGGICYLRFASFEPGPDWYYLIRLKITSIVVTKQGGLEFDFANVSKGRFIDGTWVDNQINEGKKIYQPKLITKSGKSVLAPDFTKISETVVLITINELAEVVLYANENDQPDETNCFANFPPGHEVVADFEPAD